MTGLAVVAVAKVDKLDDGELDGRINDDALVGLMDGAGFESYERRLDELVVCDALDWDE